MLKLFGIDTAAPVSKSAVSLRTLVFRLQGESRDNAAKCTELQNTLDNDVDVRRHEADRAKVAAQAALQVAESRVTELEHSLDEHPLCSECVFRPVHRVRSPF